MRISRYIDFNRQSSSNLNESRMSNFSKSKNDISDLFLDISDKYKISEVGVTDWLLTIEGNLKNHFALADTSSTYSGDTQWIFMVYKIDDEMDKQFESDFESFKSRLRRFGFNVNGMVNQVLRMNPVSEITGHVYAFYISKNLRN